MSAVARLLDHQKLGSEGGASGKRGVAAHDLTDEAVMTAAVLVATAFRLRDEGALVSALRELVEAVRLMEIERH